MAMSVPEVGKLIEADACRDAIHVAVAPVEAGDDLMPGDHVGLYEGKACRRDGLAVGVVDPFLKAPVKAGERFWLFVYPNAITHLRHAWTHPSFTSRIPNAKE